MHHCLLLIARVQAVLIIAGLAAYKVSSVEADSSDPKVGPLPAPPTERMV